MARQNIISSFLELFTIFILTVIFVYYVYYKICYYYWYKKGVSTINPTFPAGNLLPSIIGKENLYYLIRNYYNEFKANGHKFGGLYFFNGPIYLPIDRQLVKHVLVNDYNYFMDRGTYIDKIHFPLSSHMFSKKGQDWHNDRIKLNPSFTTNKIKQMYNIILFHNINLIEFLKPFANKCEIIDIRKYIFLMTLDIVSSSVFGFESNSLKEPNTEFNRIIEKIFHLPKWTFIKLLFTDGLQNPGNIMKIAHTDKIIEKFFFDLIKSTLDYRDKNNTEREDFFNILRKMHKDTDISIDEIVAQSFLFFTAGYETTSSTISYCIHELSHNIDLQEKLRQEIHTSLGKKNCHYTYDKVMDLPYLDKVVKETLRKYPPLGVLNRMCVRDYKIPNTDIIIEKNTPTLISVLGLHMDPEYFPDPLKFDPDRFDGKQKILPLTYIPFGEGPKKCIGTRFGLIQVKLCLASILCHYKFFPTNQTPRVLEVDPTATSIVLTMKSTIIVKIENV